MEMSIRERILAAYRGQASTEPLVTIYNRYLPRGDFEHEARVADLGIIDYYPLTSFIAPPWHLLPGYLSEVKGVQPSISYRWDDGKRTEIRKFETPLGTISQETVVDPVFGSDWINKHYISQTEDYKILEYVVENSVLVCQEEEYLDRAAKLGEAGLLMGRVDRSPYQKLLIELAGPERFLMDLYTDPEPVESLLAALDRKMDEMFEMVLNSSAPVIWQPDNVTAEMTPPAMYEKYILPFYKKHGKRLKDAGKIYAVHMDGRLKALTEMIKNSPFDVIESFTFPEMGGDVTFQEAQELWPEKRIFPNFPASLCHEDDATILSKLEAILANHNRPESAVIQFSEDIPQETSSRVIPLVCRQLKQSKDSPKTSVVPAPHLQNMATKKH